MEMATENMATTDLIARSAKIRGLLDGVRITEDGTESLCLDSERPQLAEERKAIRAELKRRYLAMKES